MAPPRLLASISTSPSGGCSSRDVTLPFWTCLAALALLYALRPADPAFAADAALQRTYAPPRLEPTLECLRALMAPPYVVPPRAFSWAVLREHVLCAQFAARCALANIVGLAFYFGFASLMHRLFPRRPAVNGRERAQWDLSRWDSDLSLGVLSIVCGTPFQQGFMVLKEQFGLSLAYASIEGGRLALPAWLPAPLGGAALEGWAWWALSIPVYLALFDLTFYWTHLILHWGPVYTHFHANHHAFRPPTAWSGIAVDPVENILTGMMPLHVPLFLLPFHLHTVFAVNIVLMAWATLLHSGCETPGGWLFIGPADHNVHHARGLENRNFSAIFSVWDWAFGTLDREGWTQDSLRPFWFGTDSAGVAPAAKGKVRGRAASVSSSAAAEEPRPPPAAVPSPRRRAGGRGTA